MKILITYSIPKWAWTNLIGYTLVFISLLASAEAIPDHQVPHTTPNASAESPKVPAPTLNLRVIAVKSTERSEKQAGMGEKITVGVEGLSQAMALGNFKPESLILFFNGYGLEGIYPDSIDLVNNELIFTPIRNQENIKTWSSLIGSPTQPLLPVRVSVGFKGQGSYPIDSGNAIKGLGPNNFNFIVLRKNWFVGGVIILILVIGLFIWLAKTSGIIRDSNPPSPEDGKQKAYSLAKFQASFWFFLVVGSFLFIWLITGDHTHSLTEQTLILIGIGTGTALGAAMIDNNKREESNSKLAELHPKEAQLNAEVMEYKTKITELEEKIVEDKESLSKIATAQKVAELSEIIKEDKESLSKMKIETEQKEAELNEIIKEMGEFRSGLSKPTSEGLAKDLLTDVNGINFHRFQMLVWTLVMGIIFCAEVYRTLRMPEFDTILMALMGISAGTYLGFKIPEKQVTPTLIKPTVQP